MRFRTATMAWSIKNNLSASDHLRPWIAALGFAGHSSKNKIPITFFLVETWNLSNIRACSWEVKQI
jgi:hypothetical protein